MNLKYLLIHRNTSIFIHSCIIYLQLKKVKTVEFIVNHVWNFLLVFLVWITSNHITISTSFSLFRISHWMFWTNNFSVHRISYYEYSCIIYGFFLAYSEIQISSVLLTHLDILIYPYTLFKIESSYGVISGANIYISALKIFCVLLYWKKFKILWILSLEYIYIFYIYIFFFLLSYLREMIETGQEKLEIWWKCFFAFFPVRAAFFRGFPANTVYCKWIIVCPLLAYVDKNKQTTKENPASIWNSLFPLEKMMHFHSPFHTLICCFYPSALVNSLFRA